MQGVGRGAREPPEAAWSQIRPHGHILQYRSLPSRQVALEHIVANFNASKLASLPGPLVRSYNRAQAAEEKARADAKELSIYAQ